jgi:hypothetical protein
MDASGNQQEITEGTEYTELFKVQSSRLKVQSPEGGIDKPATVHQSVCG